MRVAIPTHHSKGLNDQVFDHFGKAPTYTIADLESGGLTVVDNTSQHMGGKGSPTELIKAAGVSAVVVGHIGEKAAEQCRDIGIAVYCGATGSVADALEQLREGRLAPPTADTYCKHHH